MNNHRTDSNIGQLKMSATVNTTRNSVEESEEVENVMIREGTRSKKIMKTTTEVVEKMSNKTTTTITTSERIKIKESTAPNAVRNERTVDEEESEDEEEAAEPEAQNNNVQRQVVRAVHFNPDTLLDEMNETDLRRKRFKLMDQVMDVTERIHWKKMERTRNPDVVESMKKKEAEKREVTNVRKNWLINAYNVLNFDRSEDGEPLKNPSELVLR